MRIAYLVSRFPAFSETFVQREAAEVVRAGHDLQVYALKSRTDPGHDPAVADLVGNAQYSPWLLSAALLWANLATALRHPLRYFGTLVFGIIHGLRTPVECAKMLVAWPKTVYYGRLMARRGVQHVHAHFANVPALSALIISRIFRLPYSFTAHAHDLFIYKSMLEEKIAGAAFAVTGARFTLDILKAHSPEDQWPKLHLIHCGADIDRYSRTPLNPQRGLIVSVGRLSGQKGFPHLVDACVILRERGVDVRCTVAGEGPDRPLIKARIAERNAADFFSLPGKVPDLVEFLGRAHIFVLPCVRAPDGSMDGIPTVLIEAMAARIPVVSTAVSGVPELVRNDQTGLCVSPDDPAALADAIERLIKDPALAARLVENAYRLADETYDLRKNGRRVADLFEQYRR